MAKKDIELRIVMQTPDGLDKQTKVIKGKMGEVQKVIDNLSMKSFDAGVNATIQDINRLKQASKDLSKIITKNGKASISVNRDNSQAGSFQSTGKSGVTKTHYRRKNADGSLNRTRAGILTKKQFNAMTAGVVKFKRGVDKAKRSSGDLRRQLKKVFNRQRRSIINGQTSAIAKMKEQIRTTGDVGGDLSKTVKNMEDNLDNLSKVKLKDVVGDMKNLSETDMQKMNNGIDTFIAKQRGMARAIGTTQKKKKEGAKRGPFSKVMGELSGAFGFGTIDVGLQIQNLFANRRIKGQVSTAAGSLAATVGGAFGSAIGSISGDLGKAMGTMGELMFNMLTAKIRLIGVAAGAAIRGVGIVIASGFLGAIGTGTIAALGTSLLPIIPLIIIPLTFGFVAAMQELASEILDILGKLFKAMTSIISAGMKTVIGVFKAVFSVFAALWKASWKGLKEVVSAVMTSVGTLAKGGMKLLAREITTGVKGFMRLEEGATKAAKEIANQGDFVKRFASEISNVSIMGGFDKADVASAFFGVVSGGFQDTASRIKIISEASRLAIADMTGIGNATNALVTVINSYGAKLSEIGEISRIMSNATTRGVTSLEEMGPALRSVTGMAKFAGVGLADLFASIAAMTKVFGKGSTQSTTRFLSRFIEAIATPTGRAAKEFERLGVSVKDLGGGKDFANTFTNLLRTLKGKVNFENLRDLFPTNQSRKAFVGLTNDVEGFAKLLNDIKTSKGLQGQQISTVMDKVSRRVKIVAKVVEAARDRFGSFFATILRGTVFSNVFMRVWVRIGNMLNDPRFTKRLDKLASTIRFILVPASRALYSALLDVIGIIRQIASISFGGGFKAMGLDIQQIIEISAGWWSSLTSGLTIVDNLKLAFMTLKGTISESLAVMEKIDSGDISFKTIIKDAQDLGITLSKALSLGIAKGVIGFANMLDTANAGLAGLELDNLKVELSPENNLLLESFKAMFESIVAIGKTAFQVLFDFIRIELRDAFLDSTNFLVKSLKETLGALEGTAKVVGKLDTLLKAASGRSGIAMGTAQLTRMLKGESNGVIGKQFRTKRNVKEGDLKNITDALLKAGDITKDEITDGMSDAVALTTVRGNSAQKENLLAEVSDPATRALLAKFFEDFSKDRADKKKSISSDETLTRVGLGLMNVTKLLLDPESLSSKMANDDVGTFRRIIGDVLDPKVKGEDTIGGRSASAKKLDNTKLAVAIRASVVANQKLTEAMNNRLSGVGADAKSNPLFSGPKAAVARVTEPMTTARRRMIEQRAKQRGEKAPGFESEADKEARRKRRQEARLRKQGKKAPGFNASPSGYARGTDTVPAMLTPGEAVIPRSSVEFFGKGFMRDIINKKSPIRAARGRNKGATSVKRTDSLADLIDIPRATDGINTDDWPTGPALQNRRDGDKARGDFAKWLKANVKATKALTEGILENSPATDEALNSERWRAMFGKNMKLPAPPIQRDAQGILQIKRATTQTAARALAMLRQFKFFMPKEQAKYWSNAALSVMKAPVRRNTTRNAVGKLRNGGDGQFGDGVSFSKKFRTGFTGFKGGNAQQVLGGVMQKRNDAANGIVRPRISKELPEQEQRKTNNLLMENNRVLRLMLEEQKKLTTKKDNPQPAVMLGPAAGIGAVKPDGNDQK